MYQYSTSIEPESGSRAEERGYPDINITVGVIDDFGYRVDRRSNGYARRSLRRLLRRAVCYRLFSAES